MFINWFSFRTLESVYEEYLNVVLIFTVPFMEYVHDNSGFIEQIEGHSDFSVFSPKFLYRGKLIQILEN